MKLAISNGWRPPAVLVLLLTVFPFPVAALDEIQIDIGDIQAEGWQATGIRLLLGLAADDHISARLEMVSLEVVGQGEVLSDASWFCADLRIDTDTYRCKAARLQARGSLAGPLDIQLPATFRDADNWSFEVEGLRYAGGRLTGGFVMKNGTWQGSLMATGLQLERVAALVRRNWFPDGWDIAGELFVESEFSGRQDKPAEIIGRISAEKLAYSDQAGLQVGEEVTIDAALSGQARPEYWLVKGNVTVDQGQLYSDPVYLEIGTAPWKIALDGRLDMQREQFFVEQLQFDLPETLSVAGNAAMALDGFTLQRADLNFTSTSLSNLYSTFLQPLWIGSSLDELELEGKLSGGLQVSEKEPVQLDLALQNVSVDDKEARFGLTGLDAELHWRSIGEPVLSSLRFRQGYLYKLGFGSVETGLLAHGEELKLVEPVQLSLLGGTLEFRDLAFSGLREGESRWQMAAIMEQIQLEQLSSALDWPALSGELHGSIPTVKYASGNISLDGQLTVDVFGGRVTVEGLSIDDPLGVAPVLESDIRMEDLDLALLTQTFSFGRIEGLLDGKVDDLQLVGWEANSFQADLHTPPDSPGRRRISQRAVDNLTSLGSGVSGGLSSTFLGAFKDFAYDRISLQIDLSGARAELDGIAHPDGGYYIVKGAGLPRIDVIGRNREVAWKDLIERLQDIQFEGMVIQ